MRLVLDKIKDSVVNVLRRLGYSFQRRDDETGEMSFVKLMGGGDYPRFHIYVKQSGFGKAEINLHIDQKKVSYEGTSAHSGEYEGEDNKWLEKEAEIIKREFER
jgi:hypothetical protein